MQMNIVLRELRANLKSLMIWSFSMVFLVYVGMLKYSGFEAAGRNAAAFVEQLPAALKNIMGLNGLDVTSILGYYSIFFLYFMLLGGIHAIMLGAVIISKEERDKTADFLFVKPVPRSRVITAKLIAAFINLLVLNIVTLLSSIFFVGMYNKGEPVHDLILKAMTALLILQVLFAAVGAGISVLAGSARKAASLSAAIILSTFILSIAIDLYGEIDFLKYFTPFKYFNAARLMKGGSFEPVFLLLSAAVIIAGTTLTYAFFRKRDLHI